MLVIRFSRVGRHNHAQYRIVVQEKTKAPSGRHFAVVGSYDPHLKTVVLKEEKIKEFIKNGAQPSDSVYNLLVREGVITGAKRVIKVPAKKVEEQPEEVPAEEKDDADVKEVGDVDDVSEESALKDDQGEKK
jgi:small subunit ribosomal protein S16